MPANDDLDLLIDAAQAAGEVARKFTGPEAQRWDKPDGAGPVTEADLAVNEVLEDILQKARPDYGWLSEETEDNEDRLKSELTFIIDPIDGTRSFIEGGRTWAHSLAVVQDGRVIAGVVFLPMRDMLYAAALDQGATLNGDTLVASQSGDLFNAELLSAKPNLQEKFWAPAVPRFQRVYRPSLAYRCALVGQGRFDGMITFRPTWEWDVAAGSLIATEAGAKVTDRSGAPLRFNRADPRTHGIIAAAPKLHQNLLDQHIADA